MIITLSSFGALPDARELRDASITSGSLDFASPSAGFVPEDVGKAIVIAGAGAAGAKLGTTIAEVVSETQATLATAASTTVNATGAVFGSDCGPALAAALDALIAAMGGELVIDGLFLLATSVSKSAGSESAGIAATISGTGTDSAIWIGVPSSADAISLTSGSFELRDFSFVGVPLASRDARRVLNLSAMAAKLERCGFYGLLAAEAVIYADECALATKECDLGGSFVASDPLGLKPHSVIENKNFRSYHDDGSSWIDYGKFRGADYGKSGFAGTTGWIRADSPIGAVGARGEGVFQLRRSILDEGAFHGVIIKPTTGRITHVFLQDIRQNVSPTGGGRGIECHKVDNFTLERGWHGWSTTPSTLVGNWEDCGTVLIDALRLSDSVNGISAKNCAALTVRDTPSLAPLSLVNTSYHPVQSRFAPYAIVKEGPVSDADFLAPPAIGTSGFDRLNKRRYEKGVTSGGWIYFDMDGGDLLGPELVVNGDMAAGTTGWTAANGAILSVVGGALRVTNGTIYGRAYQVVPTVIGQKYEFSAAIPGGDAGRLIRVGISLGAGTYAAFSHDGGSASFVATTVTTYVALMLDSEQAGKFADFDSISLRAS